MLQALTGGKIISKELLYKDVTKRIAPGWANGPC